VKERKAIVRHAGEDEIGKVEALATYIGGRLGMVRTLDSSRLQASTDPLTGLLNRRAFEAEATTVLGRRGPHAVVLFDLDHFKALNDKHGHAAGDRALKVFCEALQDAVRDRDLVGRRGGEEFVALLPDCDAAAAAVVLERVRGTLAAALERLGLPRFTVSCGVAMTPRDGDELEHLLTACDQALYAAKEGGRDAVVFHAAGNEAPSAGGGCDADDREDEEAGVPHHSFSA
jgi:diguanylate cyclase (GGDEF)-like protein